MLALAGAMAGTGERAQAACSEAAAAIDSMPDSELAERLDAAVWLAAAEVYLDRYREAEKHTARALAVARATGQGDLLLFFLYIQGLVWYVQGRLAEDTELLDGAIEAARVLGNTEALGQSGRAWSGSATSGCR